jgi:8-oxo-dGTP pyrophosphatase MutT (NUDIX family)
MSAAMCLAIISKDDKILLTKRTQNVIFPNAWVLPGGHLDQNENLEDCAKREIQEETGINVDSEIKSFMIFESASGVAQGTNVIKGGHIIVFY